MKKYRKLFIISVIVMSFLFLLPNVKGFDDVEFTFERDILYNESEPTLNFFNIREQQVYNGTYNSTYSFTNDNIGSTDTDISWINTQVSTDSNTLAEIILEEDNHKNVLKLTSNGDNGAVASFRSESIIQLEGTIEFWIKYIDKGVGFISFYIINEVDATMLVLSFNSDTNIFRVSHGAGSTSTSVPSIPNVWNHLSLEYNAILGTLSVLLNNTVIVSGVDTVFGRTASSIPYFRFDLSGGGGLNTLESFIDGIGYSWEIDDWSKVNDFSNDIIGSVPEGWSATGSAEIISGIIDGKSNILQLFKDNSVEIERDFPFSTIQNVSFLFTLLDDDDDTDVGSVITLFKDSVEIIEIFFILGELTGSNGAGDDVIKDAYQTVSEFDSYLIALDLVGSTYDVYINDILEANDFEFKFSATPDYIDTIRLEGIGLLPVHEGNLLYDNFKFNYENYTLGNNIMPSLETLEGFKGLYETDKYEFSMLDVNLRATLGATSYGLWSFTAVGSASTTITTDGNIDRKVSLGLAGAGNCTIKRTTLSITESLIDVNFGFSIIDGLFSNNANFTVFLKASNESIITGFRIEQATDSLFYFDGIWNLLRNDLTLDGSDFFDINLALNYDIDSVRLQYIKDDIFIQNHVFEMVSTGKTGLFEIEASWSKSGGGTGVARIDYIGLYRDGESWHGELGIITTPINEAYHAERHYLYTSRVNGRLHEAIVEGSYIVGTTPFFSIRNFSTINQIGVGNLNTTNTYEFFYANISNANMVFTCVGSDFSISDINIEGSKLSEGSNEYFLIYTSGGLEFRENYFYVDSSNNLRFIHNTSINDVNEFIQAEFDIDDRTSTDTAISFRSNIDSNAFGFFRISYIDTSQLIPIENILKSKRVLLQTDKTIESLIILVSDTNKNLISGLTEGLVSDIFLLDINTAIVSIVSFNIIEMMIPLIIILIPTIAISGAYGKFLVAPLFILFSIIVGITSIIPIWLLFTTMLSNISFLFFSNKKEVS